MVSNTALRKFQKLVYVGKVRDKISPLDFQTLCEHIDNFEEFVNSQFFPFLTFDPKTGFDFDVIPSGMGETMIFFHFGWMNKNLKQVKQLSIVAHLDHKNDFDSADAGLDYDFGDETEWTIISKQLVRDLSAEKL